MAATIGSLNIDLSLATARFRQGLSDANRALGQSQAQFEAVGTKIQGIGSKLSVGLTAPIAALGGAFLASAKSMADMVPQLETSARLANTSVGEFQRLSHAAKSLGIESDQLGDIYKDVNEKVGEFIATGGGEMADFFEKVAPKVGVTADMFRKLSGPEALQLYVNSLEKAGLSQAQMTYYMEALASDATLLLPLLKNNGAAMRQLGKDAAVISDKDIEQLKRYNDAQASMETSFQKLTIAIVGSGLLEGVADLASQAAEVVRAVSQVSPETVKWGVGLATLAGALGPVLYGVGGFVKLLGPLVGGLTPAIGTAGAAATGAGGVGLVGMASALGPIALAAGAVYVAYQKWDQIGPWIDNVSTRMSDWATKTDANLKQFTANVEAMDRRLGIPSKDEFLASIGRNFTASIARVDAWLKAAQEGAAAFDAAFVRIATSVPGYVQRMYEGVRDWMGTRLNAVWESAASKIQRIADKFKWLDDVVVRHSYIPDMVDSIGDHMRRLDAEMVKPAAGAVGKTEAAFRALAGAVSPILERLYPDEARNNKLTADIDAVTAAAKAGVIPANAAADAIKRLRDEYSRENGGKPTADDVFADRNNDGLGLPEPELVKMKVDGIGAALGGLRTVNDEAAASFEDMTQRAIGSLQAFADSMRSGDLLGILGSVAEAFFAFGGGSLLGLKGQGGDLANAASRLFGGFRESGGPVEAGMGYVVGEKGPEYFVPRTSGTIIPNTDFRPPAMPSYRDVTAGNGLSATKVAPSVVHIILDEGPMFRATIRQEATTSATAVTLDNNRKQAGVARRQMGTGRR